MERCRKSTNGDGNRHYQEPVLGMLRQGSAGGSASPACSSSMEMLSDVRMKAMRPSRGGRLILSSRLSSVLVFAEFRPAGHDARKERDGIWAIFARVGYPDAIFTSLPGQLLPLTGATDCSSVRPLHSDTCRKPYAGNSAFAEIGAWSHQRPQCVWKWPVERPWSEI